DQGETGLHFGPLVAGVAVLLDAQRFGEMPGPLVATLGPQRAQSLGELGTNSRGKNGGHQARHFAKFRQNVIAIKCGHQALSLLLLEKRRDHQEETTPRAGVACQSLTKPPVARRPPKPTNWRRPARRPPAAAGAGIFLRPLAPLPVQTDVSRC